MEIKAISEDGSFEGLLSPYGNVDAGGDVVEAGAFAKSLKERGNTVTMLWQHKTDHPIGIATLDDRPDGLWCKGQLEMSLPKAQEAYTCIKKRIIKGLSIGFESVKDTVENGVRHLREIKLWECSIVTFPMNFLAMVTSVKSINGTDGDFIDELTEIQTLFGFSQMQYALSEALRDLIWADMTKDEKIALCSTILAQFSETFTAFFPTYLDALAETYGPCECWSSKAKIETKTGAMISAVNNDTLKTACEQIKSGHDAIMALCEGKAGSTTLSTKAAGIKSEPDTHSANETKETAEASALVADMLALITT
jgi:HK97 family phage prohead protease